ncbi:MAG TPA: 1,6-anhydro-N-acetylmuramyl-L-alanine amidase AmpD, partial [Marinobacterium sp.]|nr:1,6-anhydro-N-acetylmuramyl-L-alanine amidase AmpD [Marinobacterium sp.]
YFEQLKELEVSAHLLITRDGEIVQFVAFDKRAWHAGLSRFEGRDNCNDFSIGIELEGTDDLPYTEIQYKHLIQVSQLLIKSYPQLNTDRVTGHQHIAPGRKTDPGHYFDWDYFRAALVKNSI